MKIIPKCKFIVSDIGKDKFGVVRDDREAGEDLENKQAQTDQNGVPGYVGCHSICMQLKKYIFA